jgi:hypothetical protein
LHVAYRASREGPRDIVRGWKELVEELVDGDGHE